MTDITTPTEWVATDPGVRRRILSQDPALMLVEFAFEAGAVGKLHNHVHVQGTYVAEGSFDFTLGDETHQLEVGDSLMIPSNVVHGCTAKTAGRLIDSFTPRRDDFL